MFETTVKVLTGQDTAYRHVLPTGIVGSTKHQLADVWDRRQSEGSGPEARPEVVRTAFEIQPGTPWSDPGART